MFKAIKEYFYNNDKALRYKNPNQIKAEVVLASKDEKGNKIITFLLEYPRLIHCEFMTHRLFSRNAASSRAIPVKTKIKMVWDNPALPVHWGRNVAGMQAREELSGIRLFFAYHSWKLASKVCCLIAMFFNALGIHKQIANRILETFENYRVVMTTTDIDNFMWLRLDPAAQPEIAVLAERMLDAIEQCKFQTLKAGEWHTPFVTESDMNLSDDDKIRISASCAAQVSFRKNDTSLEKAKMIYDRLVGSSPVHASPFEHQARALYGLEWETGTTHLDKNGNYWSGNLKGWVQYRQLVEGNANIGFTDYTV